MDCNKHHTHTEALVSIVIPIYNAAPYLELCLDSLLEQSFSDITLLCIDDNSTDNSAEIITQYMQRDKRIQLISQAISSEQKKSSGGGSSAARNLGLAYTKTPYVMFCDADDYYERNAVELCYNAITRYDVDMVSGGIYLHNQRRKDDSHVFFMPEESGVVQTSEKALTYQWSQCATLFKVEHIKKYNIYFPEDIYYGEDLYFLYAYIASSTSIYYLPSIIYHYILRKDSLSDNTKNHLYVFSNQVFTTLEYLTDFMIRNNVMSKFITPLVSLYLNNFITHLLPLPPNEYQECRAKASTLINKVLPYAQYCSNHYTWNQLLIIQNGVYSKQIFKDYAQLRKERDTLSRLYKRTLTFKYKYLKYRILSQLPIQSRRKYRKKLIILKRLSLH